MSTEFYFGNMDGGDGHKTVQGQSTLGNILPQLKKKNNKNKKHAFRNLAESTNKFPCTVKLQRATQAIAGFSPLNVQKGR